MNSTPNLHPDSPEARRYNRVKRWLEVSDLIVGFVLLLGLVLTHGSVRLRDIAYVASRQYYSIAVFVFVFLLLLISKLLSLPIDFYGFRLEHEYHLSNQKIVSWLWDELKGWLVGLVLMSILVIVYVVRHGVRHAADVLKGVIVGNKAAPTVGSELDLLWHRLKRVCAASFRRGTLRPSPHPVHCCGS